MYTKILDISFLGEDIYKKIMGKSATYLVPFHKNKLISALIPNTLSRSFDLLVPLWFL
jgi:hypothetical protein